MKPESGENYNPSKIAVKDINLELMYETYYRSLCCHAERIVGDEEEAKDIVGNYFLSMQETNGNKHIEKKLSSYLHAAIRNISNDHNEHKKVKRKHQEKVQKQHDEGDDSLTQDNNDPLSMMISGERKDVLRKLIDRFLPSQCKSVTLLWMDGFSYQEIAEKLAITVNVVGVHLSRSICILRKSLNMNDLKNL